jgi:hypothetical protein
MTTISDTRKTHFIYLLIALLLFLFSSALVNGMESSNLRIFDQVASVVMLSIAVMSYRAARHKFITAVLLTLGVLVIVLISQPYPSTAADLIHLALMLAFFTWATWMAARQVLFTGTVDSNTIVGSICIYLMIGLIWTLLYLFLVQAVPGAFTGVEQASWHANYAALSYYSFVTLTTLGYGDIAPAIPLAQFLAYMEAIVGVFYVAILVASLVGAKVSGQQG